LSREPKDPEIPSSRVFLLYPESSASVTFDLDTSASRRTELAAWQPFPKIGLLCSIAKLDNDEDQRPTRDPAADPTKRLSSEGACTHWINAHPDAVPPVCFYCG
jgi:hypothetical protein